MSNTVETAAEFISASVNLSVDSTTVYANPVIFRGASVTTVLSGQVCPITDGTTTLFSFIATAPVGTWLEGGDARMSSLVVNPDDAATGIITVVYKPDFSGLAA